MLSSIYRCLQNAAGIAYIHCLMPILRLHAESCLKISIPELISGLSRDQTNSIPKSQCSSNAVLCVVAVNRHLTATICKLYLFIQILNYNAMLNHRCKCSYFMHQFTMTWLFSPLSKLGRAIYFADVFSLFFIFLTVNIRAPVAQNLIDQSSPKCHDW